MPKNKYLVPVYNDAAGEYETVRLTKEQYDTFRRGKWNIKYQNKKFYRHEIQFSGLIGGKGEDGQAYEAFEEFVSYADDPQGIVGDRMALDVIVGALLELKKSDLALIFALIVLEKTEQEYASEIGEHRSKIQRRKKKILESLRKNIEAKIVI
jgi:hypothetical protein